MTLAVEIHEMKIDCSREYWKKSESYWIETVSILHVHGKYEMRTLTGKYYDYKLH